MTSPTGPADRAGAEKPDHRQCRLLRSRRKRRSRCHAAEQRDELTTLQSMEMHPLPLARAAAYRIGDGQGRASLQCGIPIGLMSPMGQKPALPHRNSNGRFHLKERT
jgi:hypothetical protein